MCFFPESERGKSRARTQTSSEIIDCFARTRLAFVCGGKRGGGSGDGEDGDDDNNDAAAGCGRMWKVEGGRPEHYQIELRAPGPNAAIMMFVFR